MAEFRMEADIIFDSHVPDALRRALEHAGDDGFVASMPQLLHARAHAPYDNIIWNTWFTSNSEESVVTTPAGTRVIVAVHGGGIFASPARFERTYRSSTARASLEGFTGQYAAKISEREVRDVLEGRLPDGTAIPVYPFAEFKAGIPDLPMRYGVISDFAMMRQSKRGYETFDRLRDDPNMIVRAGGAGPLSLYLDAAQARHGTTCMGNWHPFNRIDPDQAQTRILFLAGNRGGQGTQDDDDHLYGYDAEYGMGGDASMHNMARYVAVARRDVSTILRHLPFRPGLEQLVRT
ncbi:MAG: hypothetical protein J4G15_06905 [Alphaproteobacteria bacterium]|nr:hypothetical protein [Alphaproteobacteria bacterium]